MTVRNSELIGSIVDGINGARSSLTCFDANGCLTMHSNNSAEEISYKFAVLIYFGETGKKRKVEEPVFEYNGVRSEVSAKAKRCAPFVPNKHTMHGMEGVRSIVMYSDELAISGWVIQA